MRTQIFDVVRNPPYLQIVKVGTASEREFRAAMEGECPGCGSRDLERIESENDEWTWASCESCFWAESFRAVAKDDGGHIWRILFPFWEFPRSADHEIEASVHHSETDA